LTGAEAARRLKAATALVRHRDNVTDAELVLILGLRLAASEPATAVTQAELEPEEPTTEPLSASALRAKLWRAQRKLTSVREREANANERAANGSRTRSERHPNASAAADSGSGSLGISQEDPEATEAAAARAPEANGTERVRERSNEHKTNAANERSANATGGRVPCPPDLALTTDQRMNLQIGLGVPEWAIDYLTTHFRARYADGEERTLARWQRSLLTAIAGRWNDQRTRPKREDATAGPASVGDLLARATRLREQELEAAGAEGSS
jgi:hypothetical protein